MRSPSEYFSEELSDVILPSFLSTLKNPRTASEYYSCYCILCDYMKKDFLDLTEEDGEHYMQYLLGRYHRGEIVRKRINVQLSCFGTLSSFITERFDENFVNPFGRISRPTVDDSIKIVRIPTMEELDSIMTVAKHSKQNYLIFALASRVGLTASQIIRLTRSNVVDVDERMVICFDSGDDFKSDRNIVLPKDVAELMKDFLDSQVLQDEKGHLFYNSFGRAYTLRSLDALVRRIVSASGVSTPYTLKDLRTRAILELEKVGVPEDVMKRYTGLSSKRILAFISANGLVGDCPADLVNYRLNTEEVPHVLSHG